MNHKQRNLITANIWQLIWIFKSDIIKSWDLWAAIAGSIASIVLKPKVNTVLTFASSAIGVTSAIIGIVLAGFAIITAFLDYKYVIVLDKAGYGIITEVFIFRFPAAVAVCSVIISTFLIVARNEVWYRGILRWFFPISVFFFLYTLFITLNLVAVIGGHMMNRSTQLKTHNEYTNHIE